MWFQRRQGGKSGEEATEALKDAQENLREVQKRSEEVSQVARALKTLRERNHFAEQLEAVLMHSRNPEQ